MRELEKRPLGAFSSAFYIFACLCFSAGRNIRSALTFATFILLILAIIYSVSLKRRGIFRGLTVLFAGMLAASLFSGIAVDVVYREIHDTSVTTAVLEGTIVEVKSRYSYGGRYVIEDKNGSKYLMTCDNGELSEGDAVSFDTEVSPLEVNEEYKYQLFSEGILRSADAVGEVTLRDSSVSTGSSLGALRKRLSSVFTSEMSERSGGFSAALLLGDCSLLKDSTTRDFRCLGISHILSISGTHLTMLFFLMGKLIPDKRRLRLIRFAVISLGIVFYMALTGFSASIVRSGVMFILATAGDLLNRKTDSFTLLSAAVLLICIADPLALFDMGLQLSYLSVLGLIISTGLSGTSDPDGSTRKSLARKIIPAFVVPAVVLPLSWLRFSAVSLVSPLTNVIFVPIITLLIPVLAILLLLSPVKVVFVPLADAVDTVISFILDAIESASGFSDFLLPLKGIVTTLVMILFAILFLGAVVSHDRTRKLLTGTAALAMALVLLSAQLNVLSENRDMTVFCASFGRDDAAAVKSEGHTLVIDVGTGLSATKKAADTAVGYGGRIHSLMLTHLHRSHVATLREIACNFHLDTLWIPLPYDGTSKTVWEALIEEASSLGIRVNTYLEGETLTFGKCTLSSPEISFQGSSAHPDISFCVSKGPGKFAYGNTADSSDTDNTVRFYGAHGNPPSVGILHGKAVISPQRCSAFDAVGESVTVASVTVVRYGDKTTAEPITR